MSSLEYRRFEEEVRRILDAEETFKAEGPAEQGEQIAKDEG
jgi:hypothetical protein